jgi:hypothetical protein
LADGVIIAFSLVGAPLVAWYARTLEQMWKIKLPPADTTPEALLALPSASSKNGEDEDGEMTYVSVVNALFEYVDLCVDWERVELSRKEGGTEGTPKEGVKGAVALLVAAAVRSGESKKVLKEVNKERSGIAIWRIP